MPPLANIASQNPQLATPSEHQASDAEDLESNVAGYKNIFEHKPETHGAETHIYVGKKLIGTSRELP